MSFLMFLWYVFLQVSSCTLGSAVCLFLYKHYKKKKELEEDGREEDGREEDKKI